MPTPKTVYTCSSPDLHVTNYVPRSHASRKKYGDAAPTMQQEIDAIKRKIAWYRALLSEHHLDPVLRAQVNDWWLAKTRNESRHPDHDNLLSIEHGLRMEIVRLEVSLIHLTSKPASRYPARNLAR